MTYLQFLLLFLVLPIILLGFRLPKSFQSPGDLKILFRGIALLCGLAFVYTTPWDNYLVKNKIWWYGPDKVMGVIGYVPIEEYCFFILQTVFTGILLWMWRRPFLSSDEGEALSPKIVGAVIYGGLSIAGIIMFFKDETKYLGLILGWACPVMLLQWLIGGHVLWQRRGRLLSLLAAATIYLCFADALAIDLEIWTISSKYTTGFALGGLPLEEALFFLGTNIMVIQGLDLVWSYREGWELGKLGQVKALKAFKVV